MAVEALEHVACDLCGRDDPRPIKEENSFTICRCAGCSLYFVSPRPKRSKNEDARWFSSEEQSKPVKEAYEDVYHWGLDRLSSAFPSGGRLLDVGSGWGFFVEMAARRGWEAHGLDVSIVATTYARERLGLSHILTGELQSGLYPERSFQAATLWNLLEHLPNPSDYLRIIRDLLTPGGVLAVRVPNMDFYRTVCRFGPLFPALVHHRIPYLAAPPPGHLYGFNTRTLRAILSRAGYDVQAVNASPMSMKYPGLLRALTRAANGVASAATLGSVNLSPALIAWARRSDKD